MRKSGKGNNFPGQRQLISFARTVVHKPKVMMLDEATANIDTETESRSGFPATYDGHGTMVIVAHRLPQSTCRQDYQPSQGKGC